MTDFKDNQPPQPTVVSFTKDPANICSLAGLLCASLAIYFAIASNFSLAIVGILWAVVFDWADGIIARNMKKRTDFQGAFGGQLDSMIDIVSFAVFPSIFLLSYGEFNPWFLPGAFLIIAAGAMRLSYFNVFGLIDKKTYMGLALDNNVIILAFVFLFERFFNHLVFSIILYVLMMLFLVLNISSIRTPKFAGKWFYVLVAYTVVLTIFYIAIR